MACHFLMKRYISEIVILYSDKFSKVVLVKEGEDMKMIDIKNYHCEFQWIESHLDENVKVEL